MKEQKDVRQRIEEGEFAQSAEISASYLDEDILIIDNLKVLQNPDPVRLQMNMQRETRKVLLHLIFFSYFRPPLKNLKILNKIIYIIITILVPS